MRIFSGRRRMAAGGALVALVGGLCVGLGLGFGDGGAGGVAQGLLTRPALAFDGTATPSTASLTPSEEMRAVGKQRTPEEMARAKEMSALQYAADQGHPGAQWKLGRMYAEGDGVQQNDLRAFQYFSQIANTHAEEVPGTAQARIVAGAFVALGRYYLKGIPNSPIAADPMRARKLFGYAASYFGDADAQYELGRLYLNGTPSDPHEAARWFLLAATKGQCRAQIALGEILFRGQYVPRQAARGLMWLTLGRECAGPGADEAWVKSTYDNAFRHASDDERAMALLYLKNWISGRRE